MICDLIKLERLKGMLLLQGEKSMSQELVSKIKNKSENKISHP